MKYFAKKQCIDPSKPIVLFMDGHKTHETPQMQHIVYKQLDNEDLKIILFCLLSKTTHKMQPLDVLVLSQVEHKWQDVCDKAIKRRPPLIGLRSAKIIQPALAVFDVFGCL